MNYTVVFKGSAHREFARLSVQIQARIAAALSELETVPRPVGCKKLHAREGYRVRVGDYRIIYTVDDDSRVVRVLAIGHREDIYQ